MDRYELISALCACGGLFVSGISLLLAVRKMLSDDGREIGTILSEIRFLKNGVSEIRQDTKALTQSFSDIESHLARMEENALQTQKRMDRFDNRISHGHDSAVS
jgi:septal ring factor EnvC (AmiA/AmiB activator)